jgi:hypothetical protein
MWKEAKAALAKREPVQSRKTAERKPATPKPKQARPTAEQMYPGNEGATSSKWGELLRPTSLPLPPNPPPYQLQRHVRRLNMTTTCRKAKPEKAEPNSTAAPKAAAV